MKYIIDKIEKLEVPLGKIRRMLEDLLFYLPYFEEHMGVIFKFQYYDEKSESWCDLEDQPPNATHNDPIRDDELFQFGKKLGILRRYFTDCGVIAEWEKNDDAPNVSKLKHCIHEINFCYIHERLCTGYRARCITNGVFLKHLQTLKGLLEILPDDTEIHWSIEIRRKLNN